MRYIKEDYLENIEQDDIVASEDSSKDLPEASFSSGFKYQVTIYLIKRFSDILNTENDIQTFYENEFLRLYKYLRRNHFIENFSEIVFFHEDQEWRYPNDVYDLVRDIKDQYYLKFDYVGIKFFINIRFSPYTLLQFCASITKSIHFAVSLRIQTEEGKECQIGSLIPITSSFGKEEFRKMQWYGNNEDGYKHRSEIYKGVFDLLGTTVKNYEAVNKELPLNIPEYLFDNIIEQLGASKIKRPAIRKDIEAKLENFDIDIDEFFSPDDIGQVAVWNVTNTKLRDIAITDSGKQNSNKFEEAFREQYPSGKIPVKVHDIFMHDTKRSYGRFVTGIFYVGPIAYKTAKDEDAVGEAFLILNLYDARRNGFWTILDKITGGKLGQENVDWLFQKFKKIK